MPDTPRYKTVQFIYNELWSQVGILDTRSGKVARFGDFGTYLLRRARENTTMLNNGLVHYHTLVWTQRERVRDIEDA